MNLDNLKVRVDELILLCEKAVSNSYEDSWGIHVPVDEYHEFKAAALSFLKSTFGEKHPFFTELNTNLTSATQYDIKQGLGVIRAVKSEINGGWIFTVKGLVSAEIFTDFLEMAEHLLSEGYKDASAVMIGSVLEEHLRHLCNRNSIDVVVFKGGKHISKRADLLNSELASANVYNLLDQKSVTSWLDLRNKAAHGNYSEYTKDQVSLMYDAVINFIGRTS
jgi:hypothetical protein